MFNCHPYIAGAKFTPTTSASKVILSVWWVMAMVMVTAYISNLVALLTVTLNSMPFRTLEEMINQDEYTWGTLPGSHMFMTFEVR